MKFAMNNFFNPAQFKELADRLLGRGHSRSGTYVLGATQASGGQHRRLEPAMAFGLSRLTGVGMKPTYLPAGIKTLHKMQRVHQASGLMDAFDVIAKETMPELDLARDHGGGYRFVDTANAFRMFLAGTFCGPYPFLESD